MQARRQAIIWTNYRVSSLMHLCVTRPQWVNNSLQWRHISIVVSQTARLFGPLLVEAKSYGWPMAPLTKGRWFWTRSYVISSSWTGARTELPVRSRTCLAINRLSISLSVYQLDRPTIHLPDEIQLFKVTENGRGLLWYSSNNLRSVINKYMISSRSRDNVVTYIAF